MAREKQLKVDEILAQRSAVPAILQPSRSLQTASKAIKRKVEQLAKRHLEGATTPKPKKTKRTTATYDLWGDQEHEYKKEEDDNDYLEPAKEHKVKAPETLAQKPTASLHQPAVQVPHPGASYNPTFEEHQALLKQAGDIEIQKAEAEQKLKEQLSYRKELDALKDELDQANDDDDDEEEEEENTNDEPENNKSNEMGKRKTKAQRNKEKRLRLEQKMLAQREEERKIRRQIESLASIEGEVKKRIEDLEKAEEARRKHREEAEKKGYKRIGKHFVKEMNIEVQLEDELSESLRQLKVNQLTEQS